MNEQGDCCIINLAYMWRLGIQYYIKINNTSTLCKSLKTNKSSNFEREKWSLKKKIILHPPGFKIRNVEYKFKFQFLGTALESRLQKGFWPRCMDHILKLYGIVIRGFSMCILTSVPYKVSCFSPYVSTVTICIPDFQIVLLSLVIVFMWSGRCLISTLMILKISHGDTLVSMFRIFLTLGWMRRVGRTTANSWQVSNSVALLRVTGKR